jgi:hypothetical protein
VILLSNLRSTEPDAQHIPSTGRQGKERVLLTTYGLVSIIDGLQGRGK